jgi:glycosyltransferase involved in cell wall biosynthesis
MVVREKEVGWVVPPDDSERLTEVILEAYSSGKHLAEMGKRARIAAEANYTPDQIIEAYRTLVAKSCRD